MLAGDGKGPEPCSMKPVSREGRGALRGAPGFIEIGKSVAINRMRIRVVL